jgi:ribonuclease P protein component
LRLGTADIAALLSGARALKRPGFSVLFRANPFGVPRLGLIVPKRVFPRAVDRNRMKRMLRELFRAQQARLGSRDILIRLSAKEVALNEIERSLVGSS